MRYLVYNDNMTRLQHVLERVKELHHAYDKAGPGDMGRADEALSKIISYLQDPTVEQVLNLALRGVSVGSAPKDSRCSEGTQRGLSRLASLAVEGAFGPGSWSVLPRHCRPRRFGRWPRPKTNAPKRDGSS